MSIDERFWGSNTEGQHAQMRLIGSQNGAYRILYKIISSRPQPKLGDLLAFFCNLYGNFIEIIGLKAPGEYSAPFWSYNFSISLLERAKSHNFMISGFAGPVIPLFYGFKYTEILAKI